MDFFYFFSFLLRLNILWFHKCISQLKGVLSGIDVVHYHLYANKLNFLRYYSQTRCCGKLNDCLLDCWLTDRLIDWWLIHRLINLLVADWSIDSFIGGWSIDWLIHWWLIDWLLDWWLIDWLLDWRLNDWLLDWRLIYWLQGWWLIDCLVGGLKCYQWSIKSQWCKG